MMSSMTAKYGRGGGGGSSGGSSGGGQQMTTEEYENTKPDELKKDIRMISGCHDKQTSADVSNVSSRECSPRPLFSRAAKVKG